MLVRPLSVLLAIFASLGLGATSNPSKQFHQTTQQEIQASQEVPEVQVAQVESFMRDLNSYVQQLDLNAYLAAIQKAQDDAAAAARAAVATPRSYPSNNGAHSDAWWRGVSVCEQGGRNDPYFGYFSIMDGSAGGLDWGTQVAMANAIIARAGDGAWAASCQAAGYSASPSG